MDLQLTIFTPAYNRAHTLRRLFDSLKYQNLKNFEWLVVDDGSTDNTEEVMEKLIEESDFPVHYIKQENLGKQRAWNRAVLEAKGILFCCLDSDDTLYSGDNIKKIFDKYYQFLEDKTIIGFRFLAFSNVKNKFDGAELSKEILVATYFDELSKASIHGERIDFFRTIVLKDFLYPEYENVKFIPEIWFYVSIANAGYKIVYSPEPMRMFFDEDPNNRLSRSSIKKHAFGHFLSRGKVLEVTPIQIWLLNPLFWLKTLIRFSQTSKYTNQSFMNRRKTAGYLYALLSYPISMISYQFE
ncbi:glycosyltransferase family 2 protein [Acinetobacter guillouiae]|uniref:glycosyltransferase family 2 protein n=1 Tax=Acinetobacter guillouiae TaxID=106649 RepID=UPI001CD20839|nr:glycosyltransferase family 2 protein [Acinetobacter guillouiae]